MILNWLAKKLENRAQILFESLCCRERAANEFGLDLDPGRPNWGMISQIHSHCIWSNVFKSLVRFYSTMQTENFSVSLVRVLRSLRLFRI
jgi:hypothetical protein